MTTTTAGSISAAFTPTGGSPGTERFGGTLVAGGTDAQVIPGIVVTATNPLVNGVHTITVAVQQKGILVGLSDALKAITSADGLLEGRVDSADKEIADINTRVSAAEDRIAEKRSALEAQFAHLEALMADLQSQRQSLVAQLGGMSK